MINELEVYETEIEKAEYIRQILVGRCTNGEYNEQNYKNLRDYFLQNYKSIVPDIVRTNRSLSQFWDFISAKYPTYKERRIFINEKFDPFIEKLETQEYTPHSDDIETALKKMNYEIISSDWKKAIDRKNNDPDGAITMSRTLLESTIKHILEDLEVSYENKDDLGKLYKLVSKELNIYSEKYEEDIFKSILGSCTNIINQLGSLRNGIGDAHGKGKKIYKPSLRHAELAVNLAGSMALFLIQTHENNKLASL